MLLVITDDTLASGKPGKFKKIRELFIACMYVLATIIFLL